MSAIFATPAKEEGRTHLQVNGLFATIKAWWMAYLTRRIERAAIIELRALSDRVLLDIGLTRSQIEEVVKGELRGLSRRPLQRRDLSISRAEQCSRDSSTHIHMPTEKVSSHAAAFQLRACTPLLTSSKSFDVQHRRAPWSLDRAHDDGRATVRVYQSPRAIEGRSISKSA